MGEGFQRSVGQQGTYALQNHQKNPKLQNTTPTPQPGTKLAIASIHRHTHRKLKQAILLFTPKGFRLFYIN